MPLPRLVSRPATAAAALALCALLPTACVADVIDLTNGQRVEGTITGATDTGIVIDVGGRERVIEQRRIRGIAFGPVRRASGSPKRGEAPRAAPGSPAPSAAPEPSPPAHAAEPAPAPAETRAPEAQPETTPPEAQAPAAPSPPPPLDVAKLSPDTLRDALRALLDLQALAAEGVDQSDYAARVEAARARVARYASDPGDRRAEVKQALSDAVRLYAFAAAAGSAYAARGDLAAIGRDPTIDECPRLRQAIGREAAQLGFKADNPAFGGLIAGSEGMRDLWACAADRIARAEELIGR